MSIYAKSLLTYLCGFLEGYANSNNIPLDDALKLSMPTIAMYAGYCDGHNEVSSFFQEYFDKGKKSPHECELEKLIAESDGFDIDSIHNLSLYENERKRYTSLNKEDRINVLKLNSRIGGALGVFSQFGCFSVGYLSGFIIGR